MRGVFFIQFFIQFCAENPKCQNNNEKNLKKGKKMFKRFLRHNFNIPLAVLLVITAVVFITVGIITGKNAVRAEAAEADSSGTLFAGSDGNFDLSDADKKFYITE